MGRLVFGSLSPNRGLGEGSPADWQTQTHLVGLQHLVAHMHEGVWRILGCVDTHRAAAALWRGGAVSVENGKDD